MIPLGRPAARERPVFLPAAAGNSSQSVSMPRISIVAKDGTSYAIQAEPGTSVMENAVRNSVPGIEAECGGACACATCHVYVDEDWRERAGPPGPIEADMLDFAYDVRPTSRLSCQIKVVDELDGLIVRVPERQS